MSRLLPVLATLAFLSSNLSAGDFRAGTQAYLDGDHEAAAEIFTQLAEAGDADAQNNLGVLYRLGHGVEQDYGEAVKWYRRAAEQGNAEAQNNLGFMYANGSGVEQDFARAVEWFGKAAEQGHAGAQNHLGFMYRHGRGVRRDPLEALKWYELAAEGGSEAAALSRDRLRQRLSAEELYEAEQRLEQYRALRQQEG